MLQSAPIAFRFRVIKIIISNFAKFVGCLVDVLFCTGNFFMLNMTIMNTHM